ncbi:hypothetical protein OBBRIDRAFT_808631 [Obba rivulosa]|uniref:Uncharacterized protein n=1 Tax=Obba rivulosa TaxID=1052685 RepID=A0A8E2ANL9_9APHY|nr:hypothetical protein OBBRIDRAFT_808631 [Obba rivulosa]
MSLVKSKYRRQRTSKLHRVTKWFETLSGTPHLVLIFWLLLVPGVGISTLMLNSVPSMPGHQLGNIMHACINPTTILYIYQIVFYLYSMAGSKCKCGISYEVVTCSCLFICTSSTMLLIYGGPKNRILQGYDMFCHWCHEDRTHLRYTYCSCAGKRQAGPLWAGVDVQVGGDPQAGGNGKRVALA